MKIKLKEKQNIFFRIAVAALLVWVIVSLVQIRIELGEKQAFYFDLEEQILAQQRINEELASESANDEFYLEQQAHDKGFYKPGESVYKEVPGN